MGSDTKSHTATRAMASCEPPGDPAAAQQVCGHEGCLCTGCRGKSCLRAALQEKEEKAFPGLVLSPVAPCGESIPSHFPVIWRLSKPRGSHTPHCGRLKDDHTLIARTCVTLYGKRNSADLITQIFEILPVGPV